MLQSVELSARRRGSCVREPMGKLTRSETNRILQGSLLPAQTSAVGKVLPAHDREALDSLFASGDGGQAAGDQASPRHELACVAAQGWAVGGGGIGAGEASVACPIVSRRGEVIAAMGAVGPPGQLLISAAPRTDLLHRVSSAALGVSRDLGARGW
jgi:DNA-binding IclR family transcriptional regulator